MEANEKSLVDSVDAEISYFAEKNRTNIDDYGIGWKSTDSYEQTIHLLNDKSLLTLRITVDEYLVTLTVVNTTINNIKSVYKQTFHMSDDNGRPNYYKGRKIIVEKIKEIIKN